MIKKLFIVIILPLLGSCMSSQKTEDAGYIIIDVEQSVRTHVSYTLEYQNGEEVLIRGTVRRLSRRVRPLRGHMDLRMYAANGTTVEQKQVDLATYGSPGERSRARLYHACDPKITERNPRPPALSRRQS